MGGAGARGPESPRVLTKVIGAIVFGVIFIGFLIWGELPFTFAVALASVLASVELFSLFERKGQGLPVAAIIGIAGSLAYVFLAHFRPIASFGYVTAILILVSFLWYMLVLKHVKPTKAVALTVFVPLLAGFCLCHLVMIRDFCDSFGLGAGHTTNNGWWIVMFVIALIWVYDILAWAVGRKLGRHKIAPTISPNKSWEGAIAGTVGVLAASVIFRLIITAITGDYAFRWFSYGVALIIAAIVIVLGPIGDLSESLMKRDYGVKDMGALIPGHGGIMDRFDSTLFVAPAVFYYLYFFVFHFGSVTLK